MTLKQQLFKQEIQNPENRYNIAKVCRKVGYTEASTRAGSQYKTLRKLTQEVFDTDKAKRDILKHEQRCLKAKDLTNASRMIELRAKCAIPELRRQDITTNQGGNTIIIDRQGLIAKPQEVTPSKSE